MTTRTLSAHKKCIAWTPPPSVNKMISECAFSFPAEKQIECLRLVNPKMCTSYKWTIETSMRWLFWLMINFNGCALPRIIFSILSYRNYSVLCEHEHSILVGFTRERWFFRFSLLQCRLARFYIIVCCWWIQIFHILNNVCMSSHHIFPSFWMKKHTNSVGRTTIYWCHVLWQLYSVHKIMWW